MLTLLLDPFIPDVRLDRDPAAGGAAAAGAAGGGALGGDWWGRGGGVRPEWW